MASSVGEASTSSSMPRPCTYKVFLSFRGEDTGGGFTGHLYAALVHRGITTYMDDKNLPITPIEECMCGVIVLSPNYASSTWCLDELHKIVECYNNLRMQLVPVFYHVKPCDVRDQIGAFEEAFKNHELRFGQESDRVRRWRNALTQVASYSLWDTERFEDEAVLVENITQDIHKRVVPRLEEVFRQLGIGVNDVQLVNGVNDVRFMGMSVIGKTSTARRVYESIRSEFKDSCFLADISETCEKRGIVQIQKDLLASLNINSDTFNDVFEGQEIIRDSLCHKRVLLVLDDVDHEDQLENLAGDEDWFGPGSRIVFTTRDMRVLHLHGALMRRRASVNSRWI